MEFGRTDEWHTFGLKSHGSTDLSGLRIPLLFCPGLTGCDSAILRRMTSPEIEIVQPQVDWKVYCPEGLLLFFAVVAEFITLNRANRKNILIQ